MIIQSGYLTEGLFGELLTSILEILPYVDAAGWKPEWIVKSEHYGEPPDFNIFPGIIQTTYIPKAEPGVVVSLEELLKSKHSAVVDGDYRLANKYWTSYFRFTDDVLKQLEDFCEQNGIGGDTLGVHYRGTDKNKDILLTNPVSPTEFLCVLDDFLTAHAEIKTVFVATDDFGFVKQIREFASGRINVITHEQPRSRDDIPLFRRHDVSENSMIGKYAILDCLTLSRCHYCLCCQSAVSAWAKILNPDLKAYRIAACKPPWFPVAHIPRYRGYSEAARKLLQVLQHDDWEDQITRPQKLWRGLVPLPMRGWLWEQRRRLKRSLRPLLGKVGSVSLRRTTPISSDWGRSRGQVIDRLYIEQFVAEHAADIRGHVLGFADDNDPGIADDILARKYGGSKVTRSEVLHLTKDNSRKPIVGGLETSEHIPSDTFDCIVCSQVLLFVYDLDAAIRTLYRILKPGGILLVTVPGVAHKISRVDMEAAGDYWRFTTLALRRLFEEVFPKEHVEVKAYGNVLAAIAFLHGFAVEDLRRQDLECHDPDFEVLIGLRTVKPNVGLTT